MRIRPGRRWNEQIRTIENVIKSMSIMDDELENFLKWFKPPAFVSFAEYFSGSTPPDTSIALLLGLDKENLKPFTKDALAFLENNSDYKSLRNGVRAYFQFQDILDLNLTDNVDFTNRHYCYYESMVYLRESTTSWLDGNVLSALTLLRPFMELAILHIYWYIRSEIKGYKTYYQWFNGDKNKKPPFRNQVDIIFNKLKENLNVEPKRLYQLKETLLNAFGSLSSYNHTPQVEESMTGISWSTNNLSYDTFYYYLANINLLLKQIVYLYVLAYPMSLFPVDRVKKWGFSGPVGIFADQTNYQSIALYLGEENVAELKTSMSNLDGVKTKLDWYHGFLDLSPLEIETDWKRFLVDTNPSETSLPIIGISDLGNRIAIHKAQFRALNWHMNYHHSEIDTDKIMSNQTLERILKRLDNW
jgi:hypothetical protein